MNLSRTGDLALLCLISGSGWLLEYFYPRTIAFPLSACIHFLLTGVIASIAWGMSDRPQIPAREASGVAFTGVVLFALPAVLLNVSSGTVSEFTSLALFCSIPLMTVLILEAFDWPSLRGAGSRGLPVSVLGLGGALLLFPVQLPGELRGWTYFAAIAACCALVAYAGIEMHTLTQALPSALTVALVSFASALLLAACAKGEDWAALSLRTAGSECLRCLVFDLPVMWFTVWLIREMEPSRISARFLIIPLITAAEELGTTGGVTLQAGVGLVLMAVCEIMLAIDPPRDERHDASSLHLR